MKSIFFILIWLFIAQTSLAQSKRSNIWVPGIFGQEVVFGNPLSTKSVPFILSYFTRGNSNICDTNGNLILCSDGFNIYDSNGVWLDGGDTLTPKDYYVDQNGFSGVSQTSIFLPMDSDIYYFVTPTLSNERFADCIANSNCSADLLLYNVIDMKANGGAGKVIKKMVPLVDSAYLSKVQMMACRHGNGKDWWLLKHSALSNEIYKFLFTKDSVYGYGSQNFSQPVWGSLWDLRGQAMFNQDGTQYASTVYGSPQTGEVFVADFDRCYGILSGSFVIQTPKVGVQNPNDTTMKEQASTGLCFSPNGKFLYVSGLFNIWQYDFTDSSWYHVAGLDTTWQKFQGYCCLYQGIDGKIYIGNEGGLSMQMSVIDNPDVKGIGCNFCPSCLRFDSLGANAYTGTPPCMPNYGLGAKICWPLQNGSTEAVSEEWSFYPNPANENIVIKNAKGKRKVLFDGLGREIISTTKDEIDVSNYAKGLYYIRCDNKSKKVLIE